MTKSSANLDRAGVSEMGLIRLAIMVTGFIFGSGVTFAYFQDALVRRKSCSGYHNSQTGFAWKSAYSLSSQFGTPYRWNVE